MKIKTNDKVKIIAGKDNGKTGKVIKSIPKEGKVIVEGLNTVHKHTKAGQNGKGQRITVAMPINVSNTALVCPKCNKEARVGYTIMENGDKRRICKKCNQTIDDIVKDNK
ncbi:MAG: 50S ribosomal protein L24 [Candidatus Paceibacterota bacterium]